MNKVKAMLIILCISSLLTSCDNGTAGLEFTLLEDGSGYSVKASKFSFQTKMSIPETYKGKPVTIIEKAAFHQLNKKITRLKEIEIPSSITTIGASAFEGCALTNVTIPDSVISIGDWAFARCDSLTSTNIPDGITSIGYAVFAVCESLTSITISDSVTSIGELSFGECSSLETVYYTGTKEQWLDIFIDVGNEELINANIIYNYKD